jgi:uncharacterized protein involved in exopolysaccharide biosynthesis
MSLEQYAFTDYVRAFRRRAVLFFGVLVSITAAAAIYAHLQPDMYRSNAEFRIDLLGSNIDLLEPIELTNYADQYIQSLEQKAITNENLREWLKQSGAVAYATDASENELIRLMRDEMRMNLVFTPVIAESTGREVSLITGFVTSFADRDPEAARTVVELATQAFLAEDRAIRTERAATTSDFLREQLVFQQAAIDEIEAEIAAFKGENAGSLPDLLVINLTSLERSERDLENVQLQISNLQEDRFFRAAQLTEVQQRLGGAGSRLIELEQEYTRANSLYGPNHPDVIRLRRQIAGLTASVTDNVSESPGIASLEAELAEARERYSEIHPDVISLKRRLEIARQSGELDLDSADPLYLQLRAQINAIDSNLAGLRVRASEIREKQEELEARIAATPQVERDFQALERELQTAELSFNDIRNRLAQAQQTESFETGERGARIELVYSPIAPDRPSSPQRLAIVIFGLFVGATLASGAAFLAEISDGTIRGSKDIQVVLQTHPIATVPVVRNSVYRAHRRRQIVLITIGVSVLAAVAVLLSRLDAF